MQTIHRTHTKNRAYFELMPHKRWTHSRTYTGQLWFYGWMVARKCAVWKYFCEIKGNYRNIYICILCMHLQSSITIFILFHSPCLARSSFDMYSLFSLLVVATGLPKPFNDVTTETDYNLLHLTFPTSNIHLQYTHSFVHFPATI